MKKPQPSIQQKDQHKRFIETARELGCDEDKERFEEKLKGIATAKPKAKRLGSSTADGDLPPLPASQEGHHEKKDAAIGKKR
jgi:hypothetical protein